MAFALHFLSHPFRSRPFRSRAWHPISTAPCNRGVELRVREGTAIFTLEFPCRQTNAGDWINCDFGTPINVQPVEWRAWQHGHAPAPQSSKRNARGRLASRHRGHRSAKQSTPAAVKLPDRPVRRAKKNLMAVACALIGIVALAAAAGSLTRISAWALPVGVTAPTAAAVNETAIAGAGGPRAENSCQEFGSAFLNSACATRHKRFAARRIHRVATFVIGRSEAQQEPLSR